ncbi:ABC transporter permease [Fundicoccus culcitae]|uniref:ABC transporter permease n=1 Tax=Fundicoccus culcitae TaxID=2969821 RepID=A0ABY5P7J1_9LACT|nr:ABC transporter permease [Fundicoccus culcitae]UUX34570.1 ABC transporter permease [Fundicoccus culcitae]
MNRKWINLLVPVISIIVGFLAGAIIMLIFGFDPVAGYRALYQGAVGDAYRIGETLRAATPLIFTGLGFAVAYTAGFFNIGLSGQALWGWLISVWISLLLPDASKWIVLPLAIIGGALAGALWAAIAGFLKAYFDASEVIVTIMLNYVSVYVSDYLVRNVITDRADRTPTIGDNASLRLDWLTEITNNSRLHAGFLIALVMIVVVYIFMTRTTLGFELKTVGLNRFAAQYSGMNAKRNIILAMVISGGLAGLGGVMNGLGEFGNIFLMNGVAPAIGFDGMAVALLGGNNPFGILFASILFGGLKSGGAMMPLMAQVPSEIVSIVTAIIIFFVGSSYIITYFFDRRQQHKLANTEIITQGGDD